MVMCWVWSQLVRRSIVYHEAQYIGIGVGLWDRYHENLGLVLAITVSHYEYALLALNKSKPHYEVVRWC